MIIKFLKMLVAAIIFIPAGFAAMPIIVNTDIKWGRVGEDARRAQENVKQNSRIARPFFWAHCMLFCNGDASRQKW